MTAILSIPLDGNDTLDVDVDGETYVLIAYRDQSDGHFGVGLTPRQARALAAALDHCATEVER